jgi:hypothetical protein
MGPEAAGIGGGHGIAAGAAIKLAPRSQMGHVGGALDALNSSTFFAGVMIMLANLGSRYIVLELSKTQEEFLSSEFMRKFFIFTAAFVATRNIVTSFILTAVFTILVSGLFHEKSKFCVLPEHFKNKNGDSPSQAEVDRAKEVLKRHEAFEASKKEDIMDVVRSVSGIKLA